MEKYVLQRFCDFHHDVATPLSFTFCFKCKADLCHNHSIVLEILNQPNNHYTLCPNCFEIMFHEEGLS